MISLRLLSPAWRWSFVSAAGPVTYALTPGGGGSARDDVADRSNGLVRQALALIAGQVQLNVGGLTVGALRPGGRQRIAPEVLDVLDVFLVGLRACRSDRRRSGARRHRAGLSPSRTIITELLESNSWKSLPTRFIACIDGASSGANDTACASPTFSSWRDDDVHHDHQRDPAQQDRHGEQPNEPRDHRVCTHVGVRHADFTRQNV